jgi:DNA-binding MarR family transcriptional regulator
MSGMDKPGRCAAMAQDGTGSGGDRFDERSFSALVRQSHRAFVAELASRLAPAGLSVAEWSVLRVMWRDGSIGRGVLAERLRVGKASLTPVLGTLERKGYIERTRPTDDRRRQDIHLTPAGQRLEPHLLHHGIAINAAVLDGIDPVDVEVARRVLADITANLDRMRR